MQPPALQIAVTGLALCSLACSLKADRSGVSSAPPADVEWIATVQVLDSGEIVAASPLLPRGEEGVGFAPVDGPHAGSVFAVGYTNQQLAPLIMGEPGGALVRRPEAGELALPSPAWAAAADASHDVLRFVAGAAAPTLTTETLAICGPRVRHADVRCRTGVCPIEVSAGSCGFSVDLGCAAGVLSARYDADQKLGAPEVSGRFRSCSPEQPPEGASYRFRCADTFGFFCGVDLYAQIRPSQAAFESVLQLNPTAYDGFGDLKHGRRGSIPDSFPTATGVVSAEFPDGFHTNCRQPGALVWRGPEQEEFRVPLPDCPTVIAPGQEGTVWVGAIDQEGCSRIARYNQSGTLLQEQKLECTDMRHTIPSEIVVSPPDQGALLLVLFTDDDLGEFDSAGYLLQLGQDDLQPLTDVIIAERARRATYFEGNWAVLAGNDFFTFIEVGTSTATPELNFDVLCSNEIRATFVQPALEGFWVLGINDGGMVARIDARGECAFARSYYGFDLALTSLVEWNGQTLVGGVRLSDGQGILAALDPAGVRLLPEYYEVGEGPVTELMVGGDGALWVVMGFRGELLRLTAP